MLAALTGKSREGARLIEDASDGLFQLPSLSDEQRSQAWLWKYRAAEWQQRTRVARQKGIAALHQISDGGAHEGTEAWFRAKLQLVAANAQPGTQAAAVLETDEIVRQLETAALPAPVGERVTAHARQALGIALSYGRSRSLHSRAREEFAAAIRQLRAGRDLYELAVTLDLEGRILSQLGEHDAADASFRESMELKQHLKDLGGLESSLYGLAESLVRRSRPLEAVPFHDANLTVILGQPLLIIFLQNLGQKASACLDPYQNAFEERAWKPDAGHLQEAQTVLAEYQRRSRWATVVVAWRFDRRGRPSAFRIRSSTCTSCSRILSLLGARSSTAICTRTTSWSVRRDCPTTSTSPRPGLARRFSTSSSTK
jgi:hypothetical protein